MNLDRGMLEQLKAKSTPEFAIELDGIFSTKSVFVAPLGSTTTQVFPYLKHADPTSSKGTREWSKLKDKIIQLNNFGMHVADSLGGTPEEVAEVTAKMVELCHSQLSSILPTDSKPASKPALFLTNRWSVRWSGVWWVGCGALFGVYLSRSAEPYQFLSPPKASDSVLEKKTTIILQVYQWTRKRTLRGRSPAWRQMGAYRTIQDRSGARRYQGKRRKTSSSCT